MNNTVKKLRRKCLMFRSAKILLLGIAGMLYLDAFLPVPSPRIFSSNFLSAIATLTLFVALVSGILEKRNQKKIPERKYVWMNED